MTKQKDSKRYGGTRSLARAIGEVTKLHYSRRGFEEGRLIADWPKIVGNRMAVYTLPYKIKRSKEKGGILYLNVYGSAATEIQHLVPLIIEKITTYIGYKAISQIKLIQQTHPKPSLQPVEKPLRATAKEPSEATKQLIASVADEKLQKLLENVAKYL